MIKYKPRPKYVSVTQIQPVPGTIDLGPTVFEGIIESLGDGLESWIKPYVTIRYRKHIEVGHGRHIVHMDDILIIGTEQKEPIDVIGDTDINGQSTRAPDPLPEPKPVPEPLSVTDDDNDRLPLNLVDVSPDEQYYPELCTGLIIGNFMSGWEFAFIDREHMPKLPQDILDNLLNVKGSTVTFTHSVNDDNEDGTTERFFVYGTFDADKYDQEALHDHLLEILEMDEKADKSDFDGFVKGPLRTLLDTMTK